MTAHLTAIIDKQVDSHYRYRGAVEEAWTYPSQEFEQKAGITGISRDYAMPGGKDPKDIYVTLARSEAEHELLSAYRGMAAEMGGLSPANWGDYAAALQARKAAFMQEFDALQANGSLDAVERKASEGYALQATLETATGLRELIQAGCTQDALQMLHAQAKDKVDSRIDGIYAALESLNPELSVLTPQIENQSQKRFVVLGALSKYNVADIKGFSIDGITWREAQKDPQWARQWDEIQQKTGGELNGWIPAKSTQLRILQQVRQRDALDVAVAR